ncbi:MAG: DEAD/DEAH box helicase [Methylococcales bacterium]|nr:DEAD/DEAH box helicase [Methylococcales bacterium]
MNIFQTHARIVKDYATYISSFLNIADPGIKNHVEAELTQGKLWPEPLLQFNPSFEMAGSVSDLAQTGVIHKELADIFKGYSLYHHQVQAIQLGTQNRDFVVTSGTGSGKSLTYIGSIFHYLLSNPNQSGIAAIVVYPMNALINSQYEEFDRYKKNYENAAGKEFPITFGQYTGQEKEEKREQMRENPPHILLTNYMMLELLLTRMRERSLRDAIYNNLRFLVFDELHTYRGRQGADVAMLIRRIRAKCLQDVVSVGTSATMVSTGDSATQRNEVARVATTLFGRTFSPEQVINEKLTRSLSFEGSFPSKAELAASILAGIQTEAPVEKLKKHPIAIWLENRIALDENKGELQRRKPKPVSNIIQSLSEDSGVNAEICEKFLVELLQWISIVNQRLQDAGERYTYLPFKLHQFISQTGSVYTTLDQDENRYITLEPGVYKKDEDEKKPIFPNVFSRASGHAFICVSRNGNRLEPREFRESTGDDEACETTDGYLIIDEEIWDPVDDLEFLPDAWLVKSRRGPDTKKKPFFPTKLYFDEYGKCSENEPLKWWGWFMKAPLLFDPTGGVFFDTKTNEGTKLTKLGSEGRSTSTTITVFSILSQLKEAGYLDEDQKLLSFTDNRQDAALQAGHFNDFVQVVRLRASIYKALLDSPENKLTYSTLGEAIFNALGLPFAEYANRNDEPSFVNVKRKYEECLQTYLCYRAIADLRRSWRIVLPNLEQCALLTVDYLDIDEVASADIAWSDVPLVNELNSKERKEFLTTILDFFRLEFAIHSENYLTQSKLKEHEKQFREMLKAPWALDRNEELREPFHIRFETLHKSARLSSKSMGPASSLGKFIKFYAKQHCPDLNLKGDNYRHLVFQLMAKLEDADYLRSQIARSDKNEDVKIYRLKIEKIVWTLGDGQTVKPDAIKRRSYKDQLPKPNECFRDMYRQNFSQGKRLRGEDHTGQLGTDTRIEREDLFRQGKISALFCSPTMELGIDIGGLSVVHLRNAPPNPANYAQRSGRAGRSGQGALIFTYCSSYSPHDRHYFQQQSDLVAGADQAPRLDLCNKELLLTHLNALAISEIGLPGLEELGGAKPSIMRFVVDDNDKMPLSSEVIAGLEIPAGLFAEIKATFTRVIHDFFCRFRKRPFRVVHGSMDGSKSVQTGRSS